eukprot:1132331-Prorocentrum_lima.AAC.1
MGLRRHIVEDDPEPLASITKVSQEGPAQVQNQPQRRPRPAEPTRAKDAENLFGSPTCYTTCY